MDDPGPYLSYAALILLALLAAFFAGSETAFSSVNKIKIKTRAEDGDKKAIRVMRILDDYNNALTCMLICVNIVQISFATIITLLVTRFWGTGAVTLATVAETLIMFLFCETIPKTLSKNASETFSTVASGPILFLMKVLKPLIFIFDRISEIISRPFKKKEEAEPTVSEEDFADIMEDAVEDGVLEGETGELVSRALDYDEKQVRDVMVPWENVKWASIDSGGAEIREILKETGYSRIPIMDDEGEPEGVLHQRTFLQYYLKRKHYPRIRSIMNKPQYVLASSPIDEAERTMAGRQNHFAFVTENLEEKKVIGIITMEDILEELVGEIYDENENAKGEKC